MSTRLNTRYLIAIVAIFALALIGACASGSQNDSVSFGYEEPAYESVVTEKGRPASGGAAAPAATAAPQSGGSSGSRAESGEDADAFSVEIKDDTVSDSSGGGSASIEQEIAAATDGRIIIRTADLNVTVDDVTMTLDDISKIAVSSGGWVVTSSQPRNYSGSISIRVPADRFDDVIEQLSDLAVKVKSVSTRSEDFTEEFTDVSARTQTLSDTLDRLRLLYERAFTVEDAITIQKEITSVQSDLESLEARLNFLSQSSAFSFISVGPGISAARTDARRR